MRNIRSFLSLFLLLSISVLGADGDKPARVGVRNTPPCVSIEKNGRISGPEIELWREIARRARIDYKFVPVTFAEIIGTDEIESKVTNGTLDFAFSSISITSDRSDRFDFSHPHISTGLKTVSLKTFNFPYRTLFNNLLIFVGVVIVSGHIMWFLEKGNELISDNYTPGVFEGMWCIVTTISTVGFGQVAPKTWLGRLFCCIVMVSGIGYFCTVMTSFTVSTFFNSDESRYESIENIKGAVVAVKANSTAEKEAKKYTKHVLSAASGIDAIECVKKEQVSVALVDAPIADHYVKSNDKLTTGKLQARQDYGIVMRKGEPRRIIINRVLLEIIEDGTYDKILQKWF